MNCSTWKIQKSSKFTYRVLNDFIILLNIIDCSLFAFEKEIESIWCEVQNGRTVKSQYDTFVKMHSKMSIGIEKYESIIIYLTKIGAIECNEMGKDPKLIRRDNQIVEYEEYCISEHLPFKLQIELTNRCNLSCVHCYHDQTYSELTTERLAKLFSEISNSSIVQVQLTGGEIGTDMAKK